MHACIKSLGASLLAVVLAHPAISLAEDKVNVNTATEAELMKLPEMTTARAKAIINYRKMTGELIQPDELELITQVKPIYKKIKDKITVE